MTDVFLPPIRLLRIEEQAASSPSIFDRGKISCHVCKGVDSLVERVRIATIELGKSLSAYNDNVTGVTYPVGL